MKTEMRENMRDSKDKYEATIAHLSAEISALKDESKTTIQQVKQDSKDAVQSTKEYSEKELSNISISTRQLALSETQKQLDYIFGTEKIQNLIQNQAVQEIKSKVVDIVAEGTKNQTAISDAGVEMRAGLYSGLNRLKDFSKSENPIERASAQQLLFIITESYNSLVRLDSQYSTLGISKNDAVRLRNNEFPKDSLSISALNGEMGSIEAGKDGLYSTAYTIYWLSVLIKKDFELFDIDKVLVWYRHLKK